MYIYTVNESTVLSDEEIISSLPAFQKYISHVHKYWPKTATLKFVPKDQVPTNGWLIVIADDSDQAGALGYHDFTPGAKPVSYIFAKTDLENGYSWTVTFTHELAEMMVDPYINSAVQVTNTKFYAYEVGDPVEADNLGYEIDGVLVSDFVTPAWFIPNHPGPVFDYAKHCKAPLQILPGGYMSIFVSGRGWTQVNAEHEEVTMDEKGEYSRPNIYARYRPELDEINEVVEHMEEE